MITGIRSMTDIMSMSMSLMGTGTGTGTGTGRGTGMGTGTGAGTGEAKPDPDPNTNKLRIEVESAELLYKQRFRLDLAVPAHAALLPALVRAAEPPCPVTRHGEHAGEGSAASVAAASGGDGNADAEGDRAVREDTADAAAEAEMARQPYGNWWEDVSLDGCAVPRGLLQWHTRWASDGITTRQWQLPKHGLLEFTFVHGRSHCVAHKLLEVDCGSKHEINSAARLRAYAACAVDGASAAARASHGGAFSVALPNAASFATPPQPAVAVAAAKPPSPTSKKNGQGKKKKKKTKAELQAEKMAKTAAKLGLDLDDPSSMPPLWQDGAPSGAGEVWFELPPAAYRAVFGDTDAAGTAVRARRARQKAQTSAKADGSVVQAASMVPLLPSAGTLRIVYLVTRPPRAARRTTVQRLALSLSSAKGYQETVRLHKVRQRARTLAPSPPPELAALVEQRALRAAAASDAVGGTTAWEDLEHDLRLGDGDARIAWCAPTADGRVFGDVTSMNSNTWQVPHTDCELGFYVVTVAKQGFRPPPAPMVCWDFLATSGLWHDPPPPRKKTGVAAIASVVRSAMMAFAKRPSTVPAGAAAGAPAPTAAVLVPRAQRPLAGPSRLADVRGACHAPDGEARCAPLSMCVHHSWSCNPDPRDRLRFRARNLDHAGRSTGFHHTGAIAVGTMLPGHSVAAPGAGARGAADAGDGAGDADDPFGSGFVAGGRAGSARPPRRGRKKLGVWHEPPRWHSDEITLDWRTPLPDEPAPWPPDAGSERWLKLYSVFQARAFDDDSDGFFSFVHLHGASPCVRDWANCCAKQAFLDCVALHAGTLASSGGAGYAIGASVPPLSNISAGRVEQLGISEGERGLAARTIAELRDVFAILRENVDTVHRLYTYWASVGELANPFAVSRAAWHDLGKHLQLRNCGYEELEQVMTLCQEGLGQGKNYTGAAEREREALEARSRYPRYGHLGRAAFFEALVRLACIEYRQAAAVRMEKGALLYGCTKAAVQDHRKKGIEFEQDEKMAAIKRRITAPLLRA
eukprot:g6869.t1